MSEKIEESRKICDCNQGRLPCTCKPDLTLSPEAFDEFERNLELRPLSTNLSAQRLLRRPTRWR